MPWSAEQRSIVRDAFLAILFAPPCWAGGPPELCLGLCRKPVGRAFGMAVTGVSTVVGYGLAIGLMFAGR